MKIKCYNYGKEGAHFLPIIEKHALCIYYDYITRIFIIKVIRKYVRAFIIFMAIDTLYTQTIKIVTSS